MLEQNNEKEELISEVENVEVEEKEATNEEAVVEEVKKLDPFRPRSFINSLGVSLIDNIISGAIAVLLFYIAKPVLKGMGYKIVANKEFGVLAILVVAAAVIYYTVCRCVKQGNTVGEAILQK